MNRDTRTWLTGLIYIVIGVYCIKLLHNNYYNQWTWWYLLPIITLIVGAYYISKTID